MSDDEKTVPVSLPVTYQQGGTGQVTGRTQAAVVDDSIDPEEQAFLMSTHTVCGMCKYFEVAEGQAQMKAQRFLERLVQDDNWQVKHLCSPTNQLGLCGAHDSGAGGNQTMTGLMHKSCDQYRADKGRFSLRKKAVL